jgi:hypothetical protein
VFAAPIDRHRFVKSTAAFMATLPFARPEHPRTAEAQLIARRVIVNVDYGSVMSFAGAFCHARQFWIPTNLAGGAT